MFKGLKFSFPWRRSKTMRKIVLGICAMDKKARSKPMKEILSRLPEDLFDIVVFGDECILNQPAEAWPVVEVLITFFSNKFPTEKALEYIELRKPFLINDLSMESTLKDRRKTYDLLQSLGIDVPFHVYVTREKDQPDTNVIEEFDEYIVVNGVQINKPLVEKPVDAEDHNIHIYYPMSAGGGSKRLFRKVEDRSSEFYPGVNEIRREGSFIYEEFVITQGTDVKVYTVGPEYAHAEARKSPVVDGRVKRDGEGNELRYPVILSPIEKEMARKIVCAFRQTVCGFDILRVHGKSYCCDVNGFSFVKNSRKYYEDASQLLTEIMLNAVRRNYLMANPNKIVRPVPSVLLPSADIKRLKASQRETSSASPSLAATDNNDDTISLVSDTDFMSTPTIGANPSASGCRYDAEELRCVIAVIRHGDRTPKQKMKVVVSEQRYLDYFHSYAKTPKKDLKVKSKSGLLQFLETTKQIIADPSTAPDLRRKLTQLRDVLERWEISGLNRKLQMKPQKWDEVEEELLNNGETESTREDVGLDLSSLEVVDPSLSSTTTISVLSSNASTTSGFVSPAKRKLSTASSPRRRTGTGRATEVLVILKWGGDLTPMGREQAEHLGAQFRTEHYPDHDNGGVLRLHATYRHDLKIKASDEGRVMKTAAAFTKGLLELEGQLTPILASLVTIEEKNRTMLDSSENFEMKKEMERCKQHLNLLQVDEEITDELIDVVAPQCPAAIRAQFKKVHNPLQALRRMYELLGNLVAQLKEMVEHEQQALAEAAGLVCPLQQGEMSPALSPCTPTHQSAGPFVTEEDDKDSVDEDEEVVLPGLYLTETYSLMHDRWNKLYKDFYNAKTGRFDLTKVPDVYDMVRYDVLHNSHLPLQGLEELFRLSNTFENCVVPQEYGIDKADKKYIAAKMCGALVEKIKHDLTVASASAICSSDASAHPGTDDRMLYQLDHSHAQDLQINSLERCVRTRLYFTSESHIHSILNVLRYLGSGSHSLNQEALEQLDQIIDVSYLSQIVFRLFEDRNEPNKFSVEVSFSSGTTSDPINDKKNSLTPSIVLQRSIKLDDLLGLLNNTIDLYYSEWDMGSVSEKVSSSTGLAVADGNELLSPVKLPEAAGALKGEHAVGESAGNVPTTPNVTAAGEISTVDFSLLHNDSSLRLNSSPRLAHRFPDPSKMVRNNSITVNMDMRNTSDRWERENEMSSPMVYHPAAHAHPHRFVRHKSVPHSKKASAVLVSKDDMDAGKTSATVAAPANSTASETTDPLSSSAATNGGNNAAGPAHAHTTATNGGATPNRSLSSPNLSRTRSQSLTVADLARTVTPPSPSPAPASPATALEKEE